MKVRLRQFTFYVAMAWLSTSLVAYGLALRSYAEGASASVSGSVSDFKKNIEDVSRWSRSDGVEIKFEGDARRFILLKDFALDWDRTLNDLQQGRLLWIKHASPTPYILEAVIDSGTPTARSLQRWHTPEVMGAELRGQAAEEGSDFILIGLALTPLVLAGRYGWRRLRTRSG
jgi:hypothetical protein